MTPPLRVSALAVHPVKSTARRPVRSAPVLRRGLADDRSWMVVDAGGSAVSAREVPALLRITADTPLTDPDLDHPLRLRAGGAPDLLLPVPTHSRRVPVTLFRHCLEAVPAGEAAEGWLRRVLGRDDVRLVWCDDPTRRRLNPAYASEGDHTAFADGYPVTLASESSLQRLNDWIVGDALERGEAAPTPLPQARFRANLVVSGAPPFAEDGWDRVQVGPVRLRKAKPVDRCVITTIDPVSLARGREPLASLARRRRGEQGVLFAVHLVPESTGTVHVGDEVTILG